MMKIIIDSQYHRDQFDDWLAGGKVEYNGKTYYWYAIANDSIYENKSNVWHFKTKINHPPGKPINPNPENGIHGASGRRSVP